MKPTAIALSSALAAVAAGCATLGSDKRPSLPSALEAGWKGRKVCDLMHQTNTSRVLRCSFAPGVGHERHFHPAHFGYALSGGRMRMTDAAGTREVAIASGSSFTNAGIGWHEVLNIGDTTVAYIIVEER